MATSASARSKSHAWCARQNVSRGCDIAAVRLDGVPPSACLAFDGATDAACFAAYVGACLAPSLRAGDVVVMDNLSCHKTAEVARLIAATGAEIRHLPAYSPDLNPIEQVFSKAKAEIRRRKPRTVAATEQLCGDALDWFPPDECRNYIRHAGYGPQGSG